MEEQRVRDLITAMYESISGPAGPWDSSGEWEIFHPDCRQLRTTVDAAGRSSVRIMTMAEYIADVTPFLTQNDFYEVEIASEVQLFGDIGHVWSTYEARRALADAEPERRGINSIQVHRDGDGRWRIMSMLWDNERPGVTVSDTNGADERQVRFLIDEMYATISGPAGPRDWARDRAVFHSDARLMRAGSSLRLMSLDQFIDTVTPHLAETDLYEVETGVVIRLFGNIGQAWSAYDIQHTPSDPDPARHGVNTFQVYRDGDGQWSIISMLWANAGTESAVPAFD